MSMFQSFLATGAMIMLALLSLNFNSAVLSTNTSDFQNQVYLTSFSLAQNVLEEIKEKSFDQTTIEFPTSNPASLTPTASLGRDSGEVYPYFNDVDDFNDYKDTVKAPYFETYYISCVVEYVQENDPDEVSIAQTFYKKAIVTVTSPFIDHSISLSEIYTLK